MIEWTGSEKSQCCLALVLVLGKIEQMTDIDDMHLKFPINRDFFDFAQKLSHWTVHLALVFPQNINSWILHIYGLGRDKSHFKAKNNESIANTYSYNAFSSTRKKLVKSWYQTSRFEYPTNSPKQIRLYKETSTKWHLPAISFVKRRCERMIHF